MNGIEEGGLDESRSVPPKFRGGYQLYIQE